MILKLISILAGIGFAVVAVAAIWAAHQGLQRMIWARARLYRQATRR